MRRACRSSESPPSVKNLDPSGHYAIICAGGWRSSQLATWMQNHGFTNGINGINGMSAWYDLDGGGASIAV